MCKAAATGKNMIQSTIAAAPCAHIPVSAPATPTTSRRRTHPHLLAACIWFWAIYLAWIASKCSGFAAYRSADGHLETLLALIFVSHNVIISC
jgi:hypothetical protein